MIAYHSDPTLKTAVLGQLAEHRRMDAIVQGRYWSGGRGCAVGCLTHDPTGGHRKFPELWGIPVELAHLMDALFELLPRADAPEWPMRVMAAIPVGADLSMVWSRWALWMLRGLPVQNAEVKDVVGLFAQRLAGDEPAREEWEAAAARARAAARAKAASRPPCDSRGAATLQSTG